MKRYWRLFDRLMRLESGIGWDPVNKSIVASSEWWDEKIKVTFDIFYFLHGLLILKYYKILLFLSYRLTKIMASLGENFWRCIKPIM